MIFWAPLPPHIQFLGPLVIFPSPLPIPIPFLDYVLFLELFYALDSIAVLITLICINFVSMILSNSELFGQALFWGSLGPSPFRCFKYISTNILIILL